MAANGDRKSTGSNFGLVVYCLWSVVSPFCLPLSNFSVSAFRISAFPAPRSHSFSQSSSDGTVPQDTPRDRTAPPLHSAQVAAPFRQPSFVTPPNYMVRATRPFLQVTNSSAGG